MYYEKNFKQKEKIFNFFFAIIEGKICLTYDIWTSLMNRDFLCITAHYIDSE